MKVTYSPAGREPTTYEFDHLRVPMSRATIIERMWKGCPGVPSTFSGWRMAVMQESAHARRILLWHLLTSGGLVIRFDDIDPLFGEVEVDVTLTELVDMRNAIADQKPRTDEDKATQADRLAELDKLIADEREKLGLSEDEPSVDPTTPTP